MGFKEACIRIYIIIALTIISTAHLQTIQFDGEGCEKINLITANQECPKVGLFSVPGDCTVFYKCLNENGVLKPFLEFCGKGYNFDGSGCMPNANKTEDCPQFHCIASLGLSSALSNTQESNTEENGIHQNGFTKPSFTTFDGNSSNEVSDYEAGKTEQSDYNPNNLDTDHESKDKTMSAIETPSAPFPYKSLASTYSRNLILQCGFSLICIIYMVAV